MKVDVKYYLDFFEGEYQVRLEPGRYGGWVEPGEWAKQNIKGMWTYMGKGLFVFERGEDLTWFRLMWA